MRDDMVLSEFCEQSESKNKLKETERNRSGKTGANALRLQVFLSKQIKVKSV